MITAAYGSWPSPVTAAMMTAATVRLGAPTVDGDDLYWTEGRADQGGRTSLWCRTGGSEPRELTPGPWYVRSRVHEYGGGEYAARSGVVVFSHFLDGRLYVMRAGSEPTPLTPPGEHRFADLRVHPEAGLVLAVREDHSGPGEAVSSLVALALDGDNPTGGAVLCSGADFYADPELSADGRLAWVEWNHPDMPWDATALRVGRFDGSQVTGAQQVAGGPAESAVHPRWTSGGELVFASDRSGWWNLYGWSEPSPTSEQSGTPGAAGPGAPVRPLHPAAAEFAGPMWQLGQPPYAVVDGDRLLVTWSDAAGAGIGLLDLASGDLLPVGPAGAAAHLVAASAGTVAAVLATRDQPRRLAVLDLATGHWGDVRRASEVTVDPGVVSVAEPVSWDSDQGDVHGWYYRPTSAGWTAPAGTLPPLMTLSHGGPTAQADPAFDLSVQYWTSRGVAVLDVDYGGSTGYGRAYRERLKGSWGLVDVADCAAGARAMGERGLADPKRLAISGGSAGGYTTLRALTATDVFTAGISLYGVGDLEALAADTHKFESRYLDGLVGPYPEARATYQDRSPVQHVDDLSAPILLLQGTEDRVVPPNQAEAMAAAARTKGLPVALVMFPGEGHGFRSAENIIASVEAQLYFLGRVFGFTPADDLTPLAIDNLPDPA